MAEIGVDMDVFPGEHNLALHSGMCPGNNVSVGKEEFKNTAREETFKSNTWRNGIGNYRYQKFYYKAKYESMVGRRGKKRELIAIGRKILCVSYHTIKNKEAFKELGYEYLSEPKKKNKRDFVIS
ncbi:MAG TPA: hypothetical protein PLN06_10570 [Bacteroidales bacterium]|nr:hypothetical protein [Bacillota bacterium]MDI9533987.1 hypothetical protein [Bacteroidota bacterium]HHU98484.1 hypothetical protein [Bacteroidales bacterium]HOU97044.1 hypothetical protein [Bacteroidales bacterium]HPX10431.1 hypothetical protein [Candidatus Cloacimonas sp.]